MNITSRFSLWGLVQKVRSLHMSTLLSKARRKGPLSCSTSWPAFTQHVCVRSKPCPPRPCSATSLPRPLSSFPPSPSALVFPFFSSAPRTEYVGVTVCSPCTLPPGEIPGGVGMRHSSTLPASASTASSDSSCKDRRYGQHAMTNSTTQRAGATQRGRKSPGKRPQNFPNLQSNRHAYDATKKLAIRKEDFTWCSQTVVFVI